MSLKRILILLGIVIVSAVVLAACGSSTATTTPSQTAAPAQPTLDIPFKDAFLGSGHTDAKAQAFTHWDTASPAVVPATCAKCHTSAGFQDFATNGKVTADVPAPAGTFTCTTCHNPAVMALTSVTFPSGKVVNTSEEGEATCMQCHQGRESKVSVDKQISNFKVTDADAVVQPTTDSTGKTTNFGFINVHYFAAGATLYGSQAQMGYEYDGKIYDPKFRHVDGFDTCLGCHDQHSLQVKVDQCAECHQGVKTVDDLKNNRENGSLVDYNGNGDTKEGIFYELKGVQDILYGTLQNYAKEVSGKPIVYDGTTYPYFFDAAADGTPAKDAKGNAIAYDAWTARLLKAAYNYQASAKDTGAFAHNAKYIIELLYDSTADLNASDKLTTKTDMSKMARDDSGHFAGDTTPFRDWDSTGTVPAGCAKCHSAGGLPQFLANGGTEVVTKSGVQITGVVGQPVANGFMCSTCHDEANWPNRYAVVNVPFPSGVSLTFSTEKDDKGNLKPVDANLCLECHQGRESTVTVNNYLTGKPLDTADPKIGFKNIHYFAAGATLFGDAAKGAYEYDGQKYVGQNTQHPLNKCTDCHDVHALTVKVDACKGCHTSVTSVDDLKKIRATTDTTDWNGNGDVTEGINAEIDTFRQALYAAIQAYAEKNGTPLVYDAATYPYFLVDANKDGKADTNDKGPIGYNAWTPRLLKAAYNYQYSIKDPGAFAHNPQYVLQFLYDSTKDLGGDVSKFKRP
ncbi:MAG: hypothetical protein ACXWNC_05430 [Anaerolineales bacterium]